MNRIFTTPAALTNALLIGFAAALPVMSSGCEVIPLATLSTVFDIAGTAVSTGPTVYKQGKLDIVFMTDYASVQRAVRLATADLRLQLVRDRKTSKRGDIWDFQLQDDLQSQMEVTIERRSPMLCRCRVDVGLFGSEPTARLVMSRIRSHLNSAATAPSE